MKTKSLLMSLFLTTFCIIGLAWAQVMVPNVKIEDDYDDSEYQHAFQALKENIGAIEATLDETTKGRPSNSDRILTPNQSSRRVQEEVPNHERRMNNSAQPSNQRSIPNDATRNPNQRSILVK